VTGDLLAAAWTAADPLGGSLHERIQDCQLCCLGLEAFDSQRATQYARQGSAADGVLKVAAAGRYG